jgi:6-pyruvoyltetrahydropterin/6-carboxytetrahydropterin synthase
MYTIRKVLKFEAAHVLDSSYSKCCQQIHGHSYLVELYFRSEKLNEDGMVVDFGKVKEQAQPFIDQFDHALIMSDKHLPPSGVNIVEVPYNPTAENMAHHFFEWLKPKLPSLFKVRFHETQTGYAEYEGAVQ